MPPGTVWDVDDPNVLKELVAGGPQAITLRHPAYPFEQTWNGQPTTLIDIGARYLRKVRHAFGLPALFQGQTTDFLPGTHLTWLPVAPPDPAPGTRPHPLTSHWVRRYRTPSTHTGLLDRTLVVFAVQALTANDPNTVLGSRLGIRIVLHVPPTGGGTVRIVGSHCSAELRATVQPRSATIGAFLSSFYGDTAFQTMLQQEIRSAARIEDELKIFFDGVRIRSGLGDPPIEIYANAVRPPDRPDLVSRAATVAFFLAPLESKLVTTTPLVADAVNVNAFPLDAASQAGIGKLVDSRPNRSHARLAPYRQPVTLPLTPVGGNLTLADANLDVRQSLLVRATANETLTEVIPAATPDVRKNEFAALSAYEHTNDLFQTMLDYGIDPVDYFTLALPPTIVRYRAGIRPGPGKDGNTVNAQVEYDPPAASLVITTLNPVPVQPLQVRFALADLKRSISRREPLGIAADPRWCWHEYGHVLLAAATGALEFRWAHSAGDALAAIMCDPASKLVLSDPQLAPGGHEQLRGLTFPWVYAHRRHDRSVFRGWGWTGEYHRPARFSTDGSNARHKGYDSEQILSTSLFRLYRALGGDTLLATNQPDVAARRRAADYTVYLVMSAIKALGPATWAPTETVNQLVLALIDADIATLPVATGPLAERVGGFAQKVVQWAFEAQGLDLTRSDSTITDEPGTPPRVDVFIEDGRPDAEGKFPRGGYMPVSLDWFGTPPAWHATAIRVVQQGNARRVFVDVRNRGSVDATNVKVRVYFADWTGAPPAPKWNATPVVWTELSQQPPKTVPAWPALATSFGPFNGLPTTPAGRKLLIFADATCADDRSNIDSVPAFPCSTNATDIVDLVAGDNNLGLISFALP